MDFLAASTCVSLPNRCCSGLVSIPSWIFWLPRLKRSIRSACVSPAFQFRRGFSGCLDITDSLPSSNQTSFQFRRGFSGCLDSSGPSVRRVSLQRFNSVVDFLAASTSPTRCRRQTRPRFNSVVDFLAASTSQMWFGLFLKLVSIPSWIFWLPRPLSNVPPVLPAARFNSVVDFLAASTRSLPPLAPPSDSFQFRRGFSGCLDAPVDESDRYYEMFQFRRGFSGCLDVVRRQQATVFVAFQFRRGFSGCLDRG